ncbi:molybdopterin molybdotransferase MoeA [Telmatospirillum sp. J64-1]|uniref:molybdopterin molybdotransferase MoeA n=1 Tax=Telmatospirillum sp. J64-1 TaxID=2502183 RepID=UPI00163D9FAC|nr:molybdopterin molybdotransferase MoeA [Telmatospirillum sp. J64-1]
MNCSIPPSGLLRLEDFLRDAAAEAPAVNGTETLPLRQAVGRVLAEDVISPIASPDSATSMRDGFAFRRADLAADGPTRLPVFARIAAGHPLKDSVPAGCAVEIFTGAAVPTGLDCVAMTEVCTLEQEDGSRVVTLPPDLPRESFVRPAGHYMKPGEVLLTKGHKLRPQDIAVAAAAGRNSLDVCRRLRVAVFSTGDELVEPGHPLSPGQVWSSNRPALVALLDMLGHEVADLGHLPDKADVIRQAFGEAASRYDAVLTTGGVAEGGEDHVRPSIKALGRLESRRLALKPGRPLAYGRIGAASFFGLPGHPVAALATALVVARPLLAHMAGSAAPALPKALGLPAGFQMRRKDIRRQFLPARIEDGRVVIDKSPGGMIASLSSMDGLVDIAEDRAVDEGDSVPFLPLDALLR